MMVIMCLALANVQTVTVLVVKSYVLIWNVFPLEKIVHLFHNQITLVALTNTSVVSKPSLFYRYYWHSMWNYNIESMLIS